MKVIKGIVGNIVIINTIDGLKIIELNELLELGFNVLV